LAQYLVSAATVAELLAPDPSNSVAIAAFTCNWYKLSLENKPVRTGQLPANSLTKDLMANALAREGANGRFLKTLVD
jgi:hypothetical protein